MDKKQFEEYLHIYGADIDLWPDEFRAKGIKVLAISPAMRKLAQDEADLEDLLNMREFERPGADLAGRIIAAAGPRKRAEQQIPPGMKKRHFSLFASLELSTGALASIGLALALGLIIGLLSPLPKTSPELHLQAFLYVNGGVL
jgi:hypothetical protein